VPLGVDEVRVSVGVARSSLSRNLLPLELDSQKEKKEEKKRRQGEKKRKEEKSHALANKTSGKTEMTTVL